MIAAGNILAGAVVAPPWTAVGEMAAPLQFSGGETGLYLSLLNSGYTLLDTPPLAALSSTSASILTDEVASAPQTAEKESSVAKKDRPRGLRGMLHTVGDFFRLLFSDIEPVDPVTGEHIHKDTKRSPSFYLKKRGLAESSSYTFQAMGRSIDAWIIGKILEAKASGQTTFRIMAMGPGIGNTEKELAQRIAPLAASLGMRIEITTYSLPEDPLSSENMAAMRMFEGAGVYLSPQYEDFDCAVFPEDLDIIYGVMSTVYSANPSMLTAKIHNALRAPIASRSGGEAFFMYRLGYMPPSSSIMNRSFKLYDRGVDITVIEPSDIIQGLVYMLRMREEPLGNVESLLASIEPANSGQTRYRPLRGHEQVVTSGAYQRAFRQFLHGANLLFLANGLSSSSLSDAAYQRTFDLLWPGIAYGQPIYPDAVGRAYGNRVTLEAIRRYGDGFADHLPESSDSGQMRSLASLAGSGVRITM